MGKDAVAPVHLASVDGTESNSLNAVEERFPQSETINIGRRWSAPFFAHVSKIILQFYHSRVSLEFFAVRQINNMVLNVINRCMRVYARRKLCLVQGLPKVKELLQIR